MSAPLVRKLTLEARAATPDGAGGTMIDWAPVCDVWAAIRPTGAREGFGAGREESRVSYRAEIRWMAPDDPKRPFPDQRFREGARVFEIIGVGEADDRRERLICWLSEGALT